MSSCDRESPRGRSSARRIPVRLHSTEGLTLVGGSTRLPATRRQRCGSSAGLIALAGSRGDGADSPKVNGLAIRCCGVASDFLDVAYGIFTDTRPSAAGVNSWNSRK